MDETTFQYLKASGFVISFALIYSAQALLPYRFGRRLGTPSWRQNVPLALFNTIALSLLCGACLCAISRFAEHRELGAFASIDMNRWAAVAITFVAFDLTLWAWHLANHRISLLWRFHRLHHSDREFDLSTSLRFHLGELLLSLPLKIAVVLILGAPILGILLFEIVFGLFNMLVHANLRLSPVWETGLLLVFILPCVHRLHHSLRRRDYQTNFGTVFSAWDRLFGTFRAARSSDSIRTGLPDLAQTGPLNLWRCLMLPLDAPVRGSGGIS